MLKYRSSNDADGSPAIRACRTCRTTVLHDTLHAVMWMQKHANTRAGLWWSRCRFGRQRQVTLQADPQHVHSSLTACHAMRPWMAPILSCC